MRNVQRSTLVLALLLGACGGETEATTTAPTEPAATTPTTTASTAGSRSSRSARDDFDPNAPEYQGDHSLPGDPSAARSCTARTASRATTRADWQRRHDGADFVHDRRRLSKNNEVLLRSIAEASRRRRRCRRTATSSPSSRCATRSRTSARLREPEPS